MEILLFLIGGLFLGFGIYHIKTYHPLKNFTSIHGKVAAYVAHQKQNSRGQTYAALVQFSYLGSRNRYIKWPLSRNYIPFNIGDKVPLLVNPSNPQEIVCDSVFYSHIGWVSVIIGTILCTLFFKINHMNLQNAVIAIVVLAAIFYRLRKAYLGLKEKISPEQLKQQTQSLFRLRGEIFDEIPKDKFQILDSHFVQEQFQKSQASLKITKRLSFAASIAMIAGASYWMQQRHIFLQQALSSPGRVVDHEVSRSSKSRSYYPIVEFTPANSAQSLRFRHNVGSSTPSYHLNENVTVLYRADQPSEAMIDSGPFGNRMGPILLATFGFLLLLFSLQRKKKNLDEFDINNPGQASNF